MADNRIFKRDPIISGISDQQGVRSMIGKKDDKLVMELPWETVELIVRDALTDDLKYSNDDEGQLHAAIRVVLEYYGGALE